MPLFQSEAKKVGQEVNKTYRQYLALFMQDTINLAQLIQSFYSVILTVPPQYWNDEKFKSAAMDTTGLSSDAASAFNIAYLEAMKERLREIIG